MFCRACHQTFSQEEGHRPRILVACGHTQCQTCIQASFEKQYITCSQCGHHSQGNNFKYFPINATLLSMINQGLNSQNYNDSSQIKDLCPIHNQKLEAYCEKDNQLLCLSCVIGNQHKSHKITPVSQKVQKDRSILKECHNKILNSQEQIKQIIQGLKDRCNNLNHEYKDAIFEISLTFNHIRQAIKSAQQKCLLKCQSQYQNTLEKLEEKRIQIEEKLKFYNDLEQIYSDIIVLPSISYLNQGTKRVFIVQNCKFKRPKNYSINQVFTQNKFSFSKIASYTQVIASIQQLSNYEKKIINQGTPTMKNKKSKTTTNPLSNREPTVLEVNLNQQYRKHFKNSPQRGLPIFTKIKSSNDYKPNTSINSYVNQKQPSLKKKNKSIRASNQIRQLKQTKKKISSNKMNDSHDQNDVSFISVQSELTGFIPVSAVNSFMGNSQVTLNDPTLSLNDVNTPRNPSISISFKDTDAEFSMTCSQPQIYHFGSFNSTTFQRIKFGIISDSLLVDANNYTIQQQKALIDRSKSQCLILQSYNPRKCLILGGKSPKDQKLQSIIEFDFYTQHTSPTAFKLSEPKSGFGCVKKNNKIYIAGGSNPSKSLKCFEEYKINALGLYKNQLQPMNHSRDQLGLVLGYDGVIYACGGINQLGTVLNSFERYNWDKNKWQMLSGMKRSRRCFSLVSLPHGIYAIGGYDGNQYLNQVEFYDFRTKKWNEGPPMVQARFAHTAVVSSDMQSIIVSGGFNKKPLKTTQILSIIDNRWTLGPQMNEERFLHCSVMYNG